MCNYTNFCWEKSTSIDSPYNQIKLSQSFTQYKECHWKGKIEGAQQKLIISFTLKWSDESPINHVFKFDNFMNCILQFVICAKNKAPDWFFPDKCQYSFNLVFKTNNFVNCSLHFVICDQRLPSKVIELRILSILSSLKTLQDCQMGWIATNYQRLPPKVIELRILSILFSRPSI